MNLIEMKTAIKDSGNDVFINQCGFSSKIQVSKQLGGINRLRNSVMHANRTLIHTRDINNVVDKIERAQAIISIIY